MPKLSFEYSFAVSPLAPVPIVAFANYPSGQLSQHELSWQTEFPKRVVKGLCLLQLVFTILIIILEVASLVLSSTYQATGVGLWCGAIFILAILILIRAVTRKNASRLWTTRALLAEFILLIFSFVLIGITNGYVQSYSTVSFVFTYGTSLDGKYRVLQAELTFGVLVMFSAWTYIGIYLYVTFIALWRPFHTLDIEHLFRE